MSQDGKEIEIGLVGYEGMSGGALIIGDSVSPFQCYTQMAGTACRLIELAGGMYGVAEQEYERLLGLPIMRLNWSPPLVSEIDL